MTKPDLDTLLKLMEVQLEAFATCEIERGCSLACPPIDTILVHFVLGGEGAIVCDRGRYELRPGRVVIVPRNLAKQIEGPGTIDTVVSVDCGCPLVPGLVKFCALGSGIPGLVLGCGAIAVGMGGGPGLFDHLTEPLVEECDDGPLPLLFDAMASELRRPGAGTKALIETMMKQILVVVLRGHLTRRSMASSLHLMPRNPQLGRAVAVVVGCPEAQHSVDSLAAAAGMSRSCFTRQFSASYGCSPIEFVQTVRLRAASRMLIASNMPVKSIATAVGYASRSHFSRAFTALFGRDPTAYRNRPQLGGDRPLCFDAGTAATSASQDGDRKAGSFVRIALDPDP